MFQHVQKSYEDIFSSTCFFYYRKILIAIIIRFARYHRLLASNSTFMTDSIYLGTIQIFQNLNEYYYYLISTKSVIWQMDTNCSPFQSLTLKQVQISSFFLSPYVFTALAFYSNHFGILHWKIVKPRDHNEIKPPSDIFLWYPESNCRAHL